MSATGGIDVNRVDASAEHELGQFYSDEKSGKEYVYKQVNEATGVSAGDNVSFATGNQCSISGNAGTIDGIAVAAGDDNDYMWIQTGGLYTAANVAATVAAGEFLAIVADANGDFVEADEDSLTDGAGFIRAIAETTHSGGLAEVRLLRL